MGKISGRQVFWTVCVSILVAVATGEHVYRRILEFRYEHALRVQRELEVEYATVLAAYHEHTKDLTSERQRNDRLEQALADRTVRLEQAVATLDEERRAIDELETRLTSARQQLEQLQGELALALEQRGGPAAQDSGTVRLERVVIGPQEDGSSQGRVVSVHPEWNFVVVDLGWNAVKIGDTVSIYRNNELLAQAKIERVQERAAAATLLPEWQSVGVQINDQVRIL